MQPGAYLIEAGEIVLNAGRETLQLAVTNTGDRPIQVGSHYHFAETNLALSFDRAAARGFRLDITAGTAVRFEPGQTRTVQLVALAGSRVVIGFQQQVMGALDTQGTAGRSKTGKGKGPKASALTEPAADVLTATTGRTAKAAKPKAKGKAGPKVPADSAAIPDASTSAKSAKSGKGAKVGAPSTESVKPPAKARTPAATAASTRSTAPGKPASRSRKS